ncbi:MAG TPA: hypothetical protein VK644_11720 [Chitinophagaceae bacterium]|nr:hypothetical protein [Chitinophagaceae bacterium]
MGDTKSLMDRKVIEKIQDLAKDRVLTGSKGDGGNERDIKL